MQYCKSKTEICNISGITEINAAYASNGAVGAFAGEKLEIIHSCGRIVMSIIGKGAAYQFKDELLKLKEEVPENEDNDSGLSSIPPSSDMGSPHYNPPRTVKGGKKTLPIIGGVGAVLVIALIAFAGLGSRETGTKVTDLSQCIYMANTDVINFIHNKKLKKVDADSSKYASKNLTVSLNGNGTINSLSTNTSKYSLYGLKVGQSFYSANDEMLTAHNYEYYERVDNQILYVNTSGADTVPVIVITFCIRG